MIKGIIKNRVIGMLLEKGFSQDVIYQKESNWKTKIKKIDQSVEDELESFDLFIISPNGDLCECYLITDELEKNDFPEIQNSLKCLGLEIFVIYYDEENDEIFLESISQKKLTVGLYLFMIESLTNVQKTEYIYRGHSDFTYNLCPSVYRKVKIEKKEHRYVEKEKEMFRTAIKDTPDDFPNTMSDFDKLVKMQHYGLPTRLLDVTQSSLIALYFAIDGSKYKDGEVLIFDVKKEDRIFSDDEKVRSMTSFLRSEDKVQDKVLVVKPKLDNPRIKAQGGLFFYFGEGKDGNCSKLQYFPRRIIIPHEFKIELKKELKRLLIDESTMYQDLQHTMTKIKSSFLNL